MSRAFLVPPTALAAAAARGSVFFFLFFATQREKSPVRTCNYKKRRAWSERSAWSTAQKRECKEKKRCSAQQPRKDICRQKLSRLSLLSFFFLSLFASRKTINHEALAKSNTLAESPTQLSIRVTEKSSLSLLFSSSLRFTKHEERRFFFFSLSLFSPFLVSFRWVAARPRKEGSIAEVFGEDINVGGEGIGCDDR